MRFPGGEMIGLYSHRWEIELGYREIKQTMQLSRLTLRSKKPELVEQELWGVLAESTELLRIRWSGDANVDDVKGSFTGADSGANGRSGKSAEDGETTNKKRKSLPASGKGEALEVPKS